jgi:hypothetical protein
MGKEFFVPKHEPGTTFREGMPGRKFSCSPSRLEIKLSQIEGTNCLGRMNHGPGPMWFGRAFG